MSLLFDNKRGDHDFSVFQKQCNNVLCTKTIVYNQQKILFTAIKLTIICLWERKKEKERESCSSPWHCACVWGTCYDLRRQRLHHSLLNVFKWSAEQYCGWPSLKKDIYSINYYMTTINWLFCKIHWFHQIINEPKNVGF